MELNKRTAKLICDIENIIGNYCWNDNAAYGEGDYIRYPVWANVTEQEINIETNTKEKKKLGKSFRKKTLMTPNHY